jgi:hypothetical protein
MRIDGLFDVKQAGKRFAKPHAIRVTIGRPVSFEHGTDPAEIARELQSKVDGL